ncbi:hypothetical protein BJX64DRAFT_88892 [Aspergillus heterothallicus]
MSIVIIHFWWYHIRPELLHGRKHSAFKAGECVAPLTGRQLVSVHRYVCSYLVIPAPATLGFDSLATAFISFYLCPDMALVPFLYLFLFYNTPSLLDLCTLDDYAEALVLWIYHWFVGYTL